MEQNEDISNQIDDVNDNLKEILQFLGNEFTETNRTLQKLLTEVQNNTKEIDTLRNRIHTLKKRLNQLPTRKRFDKIVDDIRETKADVDEVPDDVLQWSEAYRWFGFIAFVVSTIVTLLGIWADTAF